MARSRVVVLVAVVAAASIGGWRAGEARRRATEAVVTRVIDGDTLEVVRDGRPDVVRLLGVDTPESVDPERPVECFGSEAAAFTAARLTGRSVRLEFDAVRRDPYGRLLAFVVVDGRRFNDELLRRGYARLLVIPPNLRHGRALLEAELDARRAGRGLWSACPPSDSRPLGEGYTRVERPRSRRAARPRRGPRGGAGSCGGRSPACPGVGRG